MPNPTLLIVDVQAAFDDPGWGERNNPAAEMQIARLLAGWRSEGAPLIHVRHRGFGASLFVPNGPGFAFKPQARPRREEVVVEKTVNSAFIGTDLERLLRAANASTLVVCGLTTDHCCSTTARMAANLGFETWFVSDATATFARTGAAGEHFDADVIHRTALASLAGEFAEIVSTDVALERLAWRAAEGA